MNQTVTILVALLSLVLGGAGTYASMDRSRVEARMVRLEKAQTDIRERLTRIETLTSAVLREVKNAEVAPPTVPTTTTGSRG